MNEREDNFRPIIFPLSNPTSKSEATIDDVMKHTNYQAVFGSGSPFKDVMHENKIIRANQTNNSYIFPGLALGSVLSQSRLITDEMMLTAAEAL